MIYNVMFIFVFLFFMTFPINCFAVTPEELMGKYHVSEVYQYNNDGSLKAFSLKDTAEAYGWFTLKKFRLKIDVTVGGEHLDRDDSGTYIINPEGNIITMTKSSDGHSKDSEIFFENGLLHVKTDYKEDRGYVLEIYLKRLDIDDDTLCKEMGLGDVWVHNQCFFSINLHFPKGWSLNALPVKTDFNISSLNNNVYTIWQWDASKSTWHVWTNIPELLDLIKNYSIDTISYINYGKGFWVNSKVDFLLNLAGEPYSLNDLTFPNNASWLLLGIGGDIKASELKSKVDNLKAIWKWDSASSEWKVWSDDLEFLEVIPLYDIKTFTTIYKGEGFWVYH